MTKHNRNHIELSQDAISLLDMMHRVIVDIHLVLRCIRTQHEAQKDIPFQDITLIADKVNELSGNCHIFMASLPREIEHTVTIKLNPTSMDADLNN